ncbi:MAG: bifunctional phosphoribosyl-AMP cyclohydrolase/phosphoribosyl-ATP diphosphatase HisIE [Candidatus Micrarchaeota archaeon]
MKLRFNSEGLVPMVIQDANGGAVLSLFYANEESLGKMKETGYVWRFSRSKKKVMKKGIISGNVQRVVSTSPDCDSDAVLVRVLPMGPACHNGGISCFGESKEDVILTELISVIKERKKNPKQRSYTSKILNSREKISEKLTEECCELIEAKDKNDIIWEAADILYFLLVFLEKNEVQFREVLEELTKRRKSKLKQKPLTP